MTPAATARRNHWRLGDILVGSPILRYGRTIEGGVRIRLTAIGEERVLARALCPDGDEDCEASWDFHCREWHKEARK